MKKITAEGLSVTCCGGEDGEGHGEGRAVILCHGFGAPGDDLVPLQRVLASAGSSSVGDQPSSGPTRWFFPEAPIALGAGFGAGRAWWHIDLAAIDDMIRRGEPRVMIDSRPDGMDEAAEALAKSIEWLKTHYSISPSEAVVGGFSQGAMITTELALRGGLGFQRLGILSGTLLCQDVWREGLAKLQLGANGEHLRVFQSHGHSDMLLPFSMAEALRDLLVDGGAKVAFDAHPGGHEIPPSALRGFATLL